MPFGKNARLCDKKPVLEGQRMKCPCRCFRAFLAPSQAKHDDVVDRSVLSPTIGTLSLIDTFRSPQAPSSRTAVGKPPAASGPFASAWQIAFQRPFGAQHSGPAPVAQR